MDVQGSNAGLIERGLISIEMGSSESPFLQIVETQAALDQGSVEPRVRELYGRISEQTRTDWVCWECLED